MEIISTFTSFADDLEELQRVFSIICSSQTSGNLQTLLDTNSLNQNGIFMSSNMVSFIRTLFHNPLITTQHIAPVVQLFSSKASQEYGFVTWEDFSQTMKDWIMNVSPFPHIMKNKRGPVERRLLHYATGNFFFLATSNPNTLDQMNSAISQNETKFEYDFISNEEKLQSHLLFQETGKLLQNFDQLSVEIMEENTFERINTIFRIAISKASSPLDIYRNSDLISRTINLVLGREVLKGALITIMKDDESLSLKGEALKMVSYVLYCCKLHNQYLDGSLILHDPQVKDCLFHADFHGEFLTFLLNLARFSNDAEAQRQSLICLGFIAQVNENSANCISMEIVHNFSSYANEELSDRSLEALAFTIQNIVSSICNNATLMNDEILFRLIEVGSKLLEIKDLVSVLNIGFEVLAYTLPKVKLTIERPFLYNTLKRIMDLLVHHTNLSVKKSAMMTLKCMIESNEAQTEALLNANLLFIMNQILTCNQEQLKPLCCRILRILLRKPYVVQYIKSTNSCTAIDIIKHVYNIPYCHWEAIRIIKEIIGLGEGYAYSLIKSGAVRVIIANLYKFAEQDEVLREVYSFEGCYYNVPYLLDCLNTLDVILSGRAIPKFKGALGILIDQLDKVAINNLQLIVEVFLKEQVEFTSQCSRTYMKMYTNIEPKQLLINTIGYIIEIHENSKLESSKAVLFQIKSFSSILLSQQQFNEVKVPELSCEIPDEFVLVIHFSTPEEFIQGKRRIVRLGSSSSLRDLYQAIANEYRCKELMSLKIMQKDGINYTMDAEATFKKAIKKTLESLNLTQDEVEELPMCILVEFANQSQPELVCCHCRKECIPADLRMIDSKSNGICKRCIQSINLIMNKVPGNLTKSQGHNLLSQGFSYPNY